jgi:hypothetical protein
MRYLVDMKNTETTCGQTIQDCEFTWKCKNTECDGNHHAFSLGMMIDWTGNGEDLTVLPPTDAQRAEMLAERKRTLGY